MEIRQARQGDFNAIIKLLETIAGLHHAGRPDLFAEGGAKYGAAELAAFCADPDSPILVAADGEKLLGYCFCLIKASKAHGVLKPRRILWIDDLCVDRSCRRAGVATALTDAAGRLAAERGCTAVELNVWAFNADAIAFYQKAGFAVQRQIMERPLK